METKQKANRWFLIKHKTCGGIFTIDSQTFPESFKDRAGAFRCPNCGEAVIKYPLLDRFMVFLKQYNGAKKAFKNFTIKELKPKSKE